MATMWTVRTVDIAINEVWNFGVLIPVLTKMSIQDPTKGFKHVDSLQRGQNSVSSRSIKYSSFELLLEIKMKNPEDIMIRNLLEEES
ncbi:hypothetical protein TNCV_1827511 [Trichonephila clavipes]|nr:hypothetical protein TNCV_1827511 [Trichonephila clavipes]